MSGRADARSDVYSAGVVLFELLTGRKPHTGDTPIQVAYAHVHADVPPPSAFPTATPIPPYLDALVARATARDAASRPHDAKVFLSQARRVQVALRQGLPDDPELTADLRGTPPPTAGSPSSPRRALGPAGRPDRTDRPAPRLRPTTRSPSSCPPRVQHAIRPVAPTGASPGVTTTSAAADRTRRRAPGTAAGPAAAALGRAAHRPA